MTCTSPSHWHGQSLEARNLGLDTGECFFLYLSSYFSATMILFSFVIKKKKVSGKKTSLIDSKKHGFEPQLSGSLAVWQGQMSNFCESQCPHLQNERMRPEMSWVSLALLVLWSLLRGCAGEAGRLVLTATRVPGPFEPRVLTEGMPLVGSWGGSAPRQAGTFDW